MNLNNLNQYKKMAKKYRTREDKLNNGKSKFYIESYEPREVEVSSGGLNWTEYHDRWGELTLDYGSNLFSLEDAKKTIKHLIEQDIKETVYHE